MNPLASLGPEEILTHPIPSPNHDSLPKLATATGRGAWYVPHSYYTGNPRMIASEETDPKQAWALRSWKYELSYNRFKGGMILDSFVLGDAFDRSLRGFQDFAGGGSFVDGKLGPGTARRLLASIIGTAELTEYLEPHLLYRLVSLESGFDLGAEGYVDPRDTGPVQANLALSGLNVNQAIRPHFVLPWAARHLRSARDTFQDREAAIASWNCGLGGARWWVDNGKPTSGGPTWFPNLAERATRYVQLIDAQPVSTS